MGPVLWRGVGVLWMLVSSAHAEQPAVELERPLCAPGQNCTSNNRSTDEYFYTVNGQNLMFNFADGDFFKINCKDMSLEDPAMPRFGRMFQFRSVILQACGAPASYAAALSAINVTVLSRLVLELGQLPPDARLSADALEGFPHPLEALELSAAAPAAEHPAALGSLTSLRALVLRDIRVARLPPRLRRLQLCRTGVTSLPEDALRELEALQVLEEPQLVGALPAALAAASRLRDLTLSMALKELPPLPPALQRLTVHLWGRRAPERWTNCANLTDLTVAYSEAEQLPAGWLAACGALQSLSLQMLWRVRALPAGLLRGAPSLRALHIKDCRALHDLPPDLLNYTPNVTTLNLSNNNISKLPSGLFSRVVGTLRSLELSRNKLSAAALQPLPAASALRRLLLAYNPLGDLCTLSTRLLITKGPSLLSTMPELQYLSLSSTGASHLCLDWLRDMPRLASLDLTNNNITQLQCSELRHVRRSVKAEIDLSDNPLQRVVCTAGDARGRFPDSLQKTKLLASWSEFKCDCNAYWLSHVLDKGLLPLELEPRCGGGVGGGGGGGVGGGGGGGERHAVSSVAGGWSPSWAAAGPALGEVPRRALVCEVPCARACRCRYSPSLNGTEADCAVNDTVDVERMLAMENGAWLRELKLSGLRELPARLPHTLQFIDLDNNNISDANASALAALFADERSVRLTRNPLSCGCALLRLLRDHRARLVRLADTTCAGGRPLQDVLDTVSCDPGGGGGGGGGGVWLGLVAALSLGAAAAAAGAGLALAACARPQLRRRLKALLRLRRHRPSGTSAPDDRRYDVFLLHGEEDAKFVWTQLVSPLESAGLRLCVPHRDWEAGVWLPAAAALSAAAARRTLLLVSQAGARSVVTRAQVRAAAARAGGGLVVVLREGGAPGLAGAGAGVLEPGLAAAACLRWGEPRFWHKLLRALPAPAERGTSDLKPLHADEK